MAARPMSFRGAVCNLEGSMRRFSDRKKGIFEFPRSLTRLELESNLLVCDAAVVNYRGDYHSEYSTTVAFFGQVPNTTSIYYDVDDDNNRPHHSNNDGYPRQPPSRPYESAWHSGEGRHHRDRDNEHQYGHQHCGRNYDRPMYSAGHVKDRRRCDRSHSCDRNCDHARRSIRSPVKTGHNIKDRGSNRALSRGHSKGLGHTHGIIQPPPLDTRKAFHVGDDRFSSGNDRFSSGNKRPRSDIESDVEELATKRHKIEVPRRT
ncbi:hypothetical protein DFH06DRAFT_266032 [Mycena polygramma]|nr:hypothetical protein DFH06DRAFT_266032 [Mycena polygramma]